MANHRVEAVIKAAVEGNVAVFYPCECDQHESGYEHFVDQLVAALGLTEETRTLTDGCIQPTRNAMYYAHRRTPPPAVITVERRYVSAWEVIA